MVHGYARSKSRARVTNELIGDCWEECAEACEMCCEEACGCCGITAWGIFLTVFASMLMCCCWTKQTGVIGVLLWIVVVIGDIIFVPAIVMAMGDAARASNWKAPIVMILGTIIGVVVIIRGSVAIALITQIAAVGYRPARELPWRAWALRVQESQSGKLKQGGTMEKVLQRASGFKASGV